MGGAPLDAPLDDVVATGGARRLDVEVIRGAPLDVETSGVEVMGGAPLDSGARRDCPPPIWF